MKKDILLEEHLRKIKHRFDYNINESPKYRPLVGSGDEFDSVPTLTNEAGEQEDAQKPEGNQPPEPTNAPAPTTPAPASTGTPPKPEFDNGGEMPPPASLGVGDDSIEPPVAPDSSVNQVVDQDVNIIQNDIIKHNIEAMKNIYSKLENLDNTVSVLNQKMSKLNTDVEEVREPTNSEKLMSKTDVSYPYYFNLNDLWTGNWFNEQREKEFEKGIKELPDGTFIADFDDLPQISKNDVQNSFNEMI